MPFYCIVILVRSVVLFIFIVNILSTFCVFNIQYESLKKLSYRFVLIFCKLKIYNINNKYWKINYVHTYLLVFLGCVLSNLSENTYNSIMSGIFSGTITSVLIFHITFIYEKSKFKQNLYVLYKNLTYLLDIEINRINILLKIISNQFNLVDLKDNIKYIEIESSYIFDISNNFLNNVDNYDDISYISIEAYNNILNKKINDTIKELFVKIIIGSINKRLIKNLNILRYSSNKLNDFSRDLLKIALMAKEIEIKLIKANSNDNFSECTIHNDLDRFCQELERAHRNCMELKKIYTELFKEFEVIFNKQ